MIKEIVIFSIMLCPNVETSTCVVVKQDTPVKERNYNFVTALTPWQKLEEKTTYFEESTKTRKR